MSKWSNILLDPDLKAALDEGRRAEREEILLIIDSMCKGDDVIRAGHRVYIDAGELRGKIKKERQA